MGDARAHLQSVADEFARDTLAASSLSATAPWGNTDQPDFLNQSLLVDVDIVWIAGYTSDDPELTVPHPRAHLRQFVLEPWIEMDPGAELNGASISELLDNLEDQGVRKL